MKINYRRKGRKKRYPVAPPTFRHTDKKHAESKRACRKKKPFYPEDLELVDCPGN